MPRPPKTPVKTGPVVPRTTFILDNGASSIKAGFAPGESVSDESTLSSCHIIPNVIARTREKKIYVASKIDEITQWDEAVLRRPCEHGQVVSWDAQKEIWDRSFFDPAYADSNVCVREPEDTTLVFTEPPNTLSVLQKNADEIIIEEWGFGGYWRTFGSSLNAYNDLNPKFETSDSHPTNASNDQPRECLLVIDSGYSHTIVTPVFKGIPLQRAIRRLDFGGKHLTNLLKEVVSVRYFDLHQDVKIVNDIKEDVCFVSQDFRRDMECTWKGNQTRLNNQLTSTTTQSTDNTQAMDLDNPTEEATQKDLRIDYILPDGVNLIRGYPRPHDSSSAAARQRKLNALKPGSEIVMTLGSERFTVPEILFNPSDIGSKQPGLAECVMQSLAVLPPLVQATMLSNVLVVGGNAKIPGFVVRIYDELRMQVRGDWVVRVRKLEDPLTSTWLGGARLASRNFEVVKERSVTKEEYYEYGSAWVARKFASASG